MAQPTTARPGLSFLLGVLAFCLVGGLVLSVRSYLTSTKSYEAQRAELRLRRISQLRKDDRHKLTTYAWADKAKGVAVIPVERAMELTLAGLQTQEPAASTVKAEANTTNIVPPAQQPAAAPVPAASGTASAPAATAK